MGDLSKHFSRYEFACQCGCGQDTVDAELIKVLEDLRECFGPVHINSGVRCEQHNKSVGGAGTSKHVLGKAADISLDVHPLKIAQYLDNEYSMKYGIGTYDSWVHIDVRPNKTRWFK